MSAAIATVAPSARRHVHWMRWLVFATAYSVAQQLVTTAWNILFAIVLRAWAFGWSGGKQLVEQSYGQAKEKEAERKAAHAAKKRAKEEAKLAHESPAPAGGAGASGRASG